MIWINRRYNSNGYFLTVSRNRIFALKPLIQTDHLTYRQPGIEEEFPPILKDINFTIYPGELIALVGANGSGKTTLARQLNALLLPTEGNVYINGENTRNRQAVPKIRSEIGMVFQHPEDQIVATIVEEDVAFGPENLCRLPKIIREQVNRSLAVVNADSYRFRQPHMLSAGQMQRVALAGVLAMQPSAIIFDETTAMLDPIGRRDVLQCMGDLNRMGITIIFITHIMEEVNLANRVLLLNEGSLIFDGAPEVLFSDPNLLDTGGLEQPTEYRIYEAFPDWFTGFKGKKIDLKDLFGAIPDFTGPFRQRDKLTPRSSQPAIDEIEIQNLSYTYLAGNILQQQALYDVSMTVPKGFPHGIIGATGSGKSSLLQHLNGLYLPQSGRVKVGPFDLNSMNFDLRALRHYAGLVFQNPESYFFKQYVGDEIAYGPKLFYGTENLRERVKWAMNFVGLDFETFKDRITATLSGGEQRKVALAATLASHPSLLIMDEPTCGLDPRSRRNLIENLRSLQKNEMQLIISTHNMDDIVELAENVTVLSEGRSISNLPVSQVFSDREKLESVGLDQPISVRFAQCLRDKGWPISSDAVTLGEIFTEVNDLPSFNKNE